MTPAPENDAPLPEGEQPDLRPLADLMARLRAPGGCPWDRAQNHHSLIPYTIEEVYEVIEAVERGDLPGLREELGDLLFHVVFYSQIAAEAGHFTLAEVIREVTAKMVQRHPHVFGQANAESAEAVVPLWEEMKRQEKRADPDHPPRSVFHGLSGKQPALLWAYKVQQKMAKVGFDWPDADGVGEKVREELAELEEARRTADGDQIEEEMGDVLFTMANLARHLGINPEQALRRSTLKFQRRFRYMEERLHREGRTPEEVSLPELESLWQESKADRGPG